jgi:hypothetical protein
MTTNRNETLSLIIDPDLAAGALDRMSLQDCHAIYVLRDAFEQRNISQARRRQLTDAVTRPSRLPQRPAQIDSVLVLGVDPDDQATLTDAVFTEQRDHGTYWRVLVLTTRRPGGRRRPPAAAPRPGQAAMAAQRDRRGPEAPGRPRPGRTG